VQELLSRPGPGARQATADAGLVLVGEAELAAARRVTYRIRQRLRYTYDGPAHDLAHRLVVLPPSRHGDQVARQGDLCVSAPAARVSWERGRDGLRAATVTLAEVPEVLDFDVTAVVDRGPEAAWPLLPASALTGRRLLAPTPLTVPGATLAAVAGRLRAADPLTTARRCCSWVFDNIAYLPGSTTVGTTAAEAAAAGAGVCQDQAHVMIALCRAADLPARYVLGHLAGDGDSHAWVEVLLPDGWAPDPPGPAAAGPLAGAGLGAGSMAPGGAGAAAVAFDPCHNRLADRRYVTIAAGRDYHDVMPTSGWYCGSGRGALTATQRVEITALDGVPTGFDEI
jgi:transglutaminase-like putative cysteine protease